VVGVAALRKRKNHHPGCEVTDRLDHDPAGGIGVLQVGVGKPGVLPFRDTQDGRGPLGLLTPKVGGASGAGLTGGEVENGGRVALVYGSKEGAGAGEFYVVRVGGDGEEVDGHAGMILLRSEIRGCPSCIT
jgi:hypothetical protein